jgi:hypothetical protein
MKSKLLALGLSGLFSLVVFSPADAHACGGCFHGEPATPSQSPSVVTDHRMVLSLTATMTTLWDQVEYAGDPEEFAWVLPIRGKVVVGLGSDSFISGLDTQTAPVIRSPRSSCAPQFAFGEGSGSSGCGMSSSDEATSASPPAENGGLGWQEDSGVFVTDRSTVGPYETVQVHGTDAGGIIGWLRANKYVVPVELEPMLQKYVTEGFDFVAVKLRPGVGVHAMRPIRVSFKGPYPTLPLRMVAAGVGAKVGLKLFVIGDGRWKTANFPTLAIDPQMVTWDFTAQRSDYTLIRDRESQKFEGRAWTLEASVDLMRSPVPVTFEPLPATPDAAVPAKDTGAVVDSATSDAGDETAADASDEDGGTDAATDTATPLPDYDAGAAPGVDPYASDLEVAFGTDSARRVTRLRADLASKYLDVDLVLEADDNQAVLPRELQVIKAVNENCPPSSNAQSSSSNDGCDCNVVVTNKKLHVPVGLCAAAFALALVRRRRR